MPSPPKPWERNSGRSVQIGSAPSSPVPTTSESADPPPIPPRPPTMSTSANFAPNYNYSSYGPPYGARTGYNSYGFYSPYNRYGYGSYGGSYGMHHPGRTYGENSVVSRMEQNTVATFQMLESIVQAFAGFAQMLESTYHAMYSSFTAMVGVADQFGHLKNYLGQLLSLFTFIRTIRSLFRRLRGKSADADEISSENFKDFTRTRSYSKRPLIMFLLAVFGIPYLLNRLMRAMSKLPISGINEMQDNGRKRIEFARALYDFHGSNDVGELSFKRGDAIAILSRLDLHGNPSQWWRGRLRNGNVGIFPANYVQLSEKTVSISADEFLQTGD